MNNKKLTVDELRQKCKSLNLPSDGKKDDLIKRLSTEENKTESLFNVDPDINFKIDNQTTLYIQLKFSNIPHYFNSGVIYPLSLEESLIYRHDNRKKDIFNDFEEYIILLKNPINYFLEDEVLLEIVTNELFHVPLVPQQVFYTTDPIPISRVRNILFKSASALKSFISSVKTFPDTFIPEDLCKISPFSLKEVSVDTVRFKLPKNQELDLWKQKIKKFDKILGLFAFLKNAGNFYAEQENNYQEYPSILINILGSINTHYSTNSRDVSIYRYILFPNDFDVTSTQRSLFRQIITLIYDDVEFTFDIAKNIIKGTLEFEEIPKQEADELIFVVECLEKLNTHKIAFKDLLLIESIRKNYPILALLFLVKFPNKNRQHTDKQAVRNIFIYNDTQLNKSIIDFLLSILGIYYGYKRMIKEDTNLRFDDPFFSTLAEKHQSIKFKLTSHLDRVIIQSVFDFCDTDKSTINNYAYLESPSKENKKYTPPHWGNFDYKDDSYEIFNTKILNFIRQDKSEQLMKLIDETYPNTISSSSYILYYLLTKINIDKDTLKLIIKKNSSKIDFSQIIKILELDKIIKK